jgi:hypothetical protein
MDMSESSNQSIDQTSYEDQFALSDASEGAVTLSTSINDNKFQLIYQAKEESVGGTKLRIAKNIVDFAKSYRCSHVLLIDGSCWISPDKGISLLAQIEGNEKLDKYEYVVFPLDHAVYIAKINEGIVVEERVRPSDRAIAYLQKQKNAEIAILAGGHAYEELASQNFIVNCDLILFTVDSEAKKYRYKAINLVLIANKLFHSRLLIPVVITLVPVLIIAFLFSPLYSVNIEKTKMETSGSFLDLDIKPSRLKTATVVKEVPIVPQVILDNNASQLLTEITPWVTGKTINFLRTCRLKTIEISKQSLSFKGERMSNIKKNQLGCGNARLDNIAQANALRINREKDSWSFALAMQPNIAQTTDKKDYSQTIERLELINQHIGWRLNIISTINNGDKQRLKVLLQGKNLNSQVLNVISQGLIHYPTEFIKGTIQFNPNNFDLLDAQFEIDIHTQSSSTL